tara:strand:+ start:347 stop:589 length:243 start_codon:yes stop_codon:yes gene_type:complete
LKGALVERSLPLLEGGVLLGVVESPPPGAVEPPPPGVVESPPPGVVEPPPPGVVESPGATVLVEPLGSGAPERTPLRPRA